MMKSFRDELRCLLIGRGMPYEKIAFVVSLVITVLFTVMMGAGAEAGCVTLSEGAGGTEQSG